MEADLGQGPVLSAGGLTKRFGRRTVLDTVSFTVAEGEVHGLLGPNGSGKTTCLHLVTGLLAADAGAAVIAGVPVHDKVSRALLGMAPDDLPLPASLTGGEYLRFHDRMRGRDDARSARELAEAFGLAGELDRQIHEYSHGMKRKLQVVAATMHRPPLLVLDEPFRGLDPEAAVTLRRLVGSYADSGGAVLLATHDMLRAQRDCHRVTILHSGSIAAQGEPYQLRQDHGAATLEDVFLAATDREGEQARRADALTAVLREGDERH